MRPWVLGFTRRILSATADAPAFEGKAAALLWNFGASHPYPHGVRTLAERKFLPAIEPLLAIDRTKDDLATEPADAYERLMWRQTGGRHSAAYYARLKASRVVACFCGELIPPLPFRNPECYLVGGNRARIRRVMHELLGRLDSRPLRLVQWDSFRFWESLMAGCVAFNPDLARYGAQLPVMPENWKHYIGIDFARVGEAIERIRTDPGCLERIANEGRRWALENYAPRRMAERFLEHAGVGTVA
jgi:hypothetical protein